MGIQGYVKRCSLISCTVLLKLFKNNDITTNNNSNSNNINDNDKTAKGLTLGVIL